MVFPDETEPKHGKVYVLQWERSRALTSSLGGGGKLSVICEKDFRGAVYQMSSFAGGLLCAINRFAFML